MLFPGVTRTNSLVLLMTPLFLLACTAPKHQFNLFGNEVTYESDVLEQAHDQPFLDLINVEKLNYNLVPKLSNKEMHEFVAAALSKTQPPTVLEKPLLMYVYTTDESGSANMISVDKTHAFSIFIDSEGQLEHRYFEKGGSTSFSEIPSLRLTLDGGFSNDDVRMLHFAAIGKHGLPDNSTIYEFNLRPDTDSISPEEVDYSLRTALLTDPERYWGAFTSGLYGEELQVALMAPQQPGADNFCGMVNPGPGNLFNDGPIDPVTECPVGSDPCYMDPVGGTKKYCTSKDKGGCFAAMATTMSQRVEFEDTTIDFEQLWRFQNEFLLKYDLGRDYIAAYLLTSLFIELDLDSLRLAVDTLPHVYDAIDVLMSDGNQQVVVTPELFDLTTALIADVRHIEDGSFQFVLDRLENDINEFRGLTRGEMVRIFETRPSVSLNYQEKSVD